MRFYLAAAVAVTILSAFGAKSLFFRTPPVAADTHAVAASTIDILRMHIEHPSMDKLPVPEIKDPF